MEGTETLCPHATILNHRWVPGTRSWLLSVKPDKWMHLSPIYTRVHGEWLRYANSTSQYSLAFSLRDDWGFQVNPLCRHDITSPFPPSGNEGYVRNRDVLLTGTFPTTFKQARVTPLLKKPTLNTSLLDSYRPISLLPFLAKTLERVVFNQVSLFLSQNNKLDANQSGFRSGHSTETVLLLVTEALRIAKADSKSSVLILLDLSAAFDTVNHQILLSTLSTLGITGIPLRWFESYLTGRSFRVAWGGEASKAHQLVTGVPQGSVLGPLLFSIYTTSLGPIIQAHGFSYHCYGSDTQLYISFQPDDPTFTFTHLADAFIQSALHWIQVTVLHFISSCFPWESNPWSCRC